jgi:hypothetical protein
MRLVPGSHLGLYEIVGTRFLITRPAGQQGLAQGVAVVQNWTAEFTKKR